MSRRKFVTQRGGGGGGVRWLVTTRNNYSVIIIITLVPHRGTPCADSHLTLDFVVPCPLSYASVFAHKYVSWDATLIQDSKYDPACLRVLAHSSLLLRHTAFKYFNRPRQYSQLPRMTYNGEG